MKTRRGDAERFLTLAEASARYRISERKIRREANAGNVTIYTRGDDRRTRFVRVDDLDKLAGFEPVALRPQRANVA